MSRPLDLPDMTTRPHGVRSRYVAGCRCDRCRAANTEFARRRAREAKLRAQLLPKGQPNEPCAQEWTAPDGSKQIRFYKRACPGIDNEFCASKSHLRRDSVAGVCAKCREKLVWNGIISSEAARRHILKLARVGVGRRSISAACDVSQSLIQEIKKGKALRIRKEVERRILAVTPETARGAGNLATEPSSHNSGERNARREVLQHDHGDMSAVLKNTVPTRPVVRYHGGKWRLAPWIISHFPRHRIYVEPFGGAGSVLLQKPRSYAEIYNDLNSEIVNLFRILRDKKSARELGRLLRLTPFAREEWENAYLQGIGPVEGARDTVIRAYMGFGSASTNAAHSTGFRASANRSGTTPAHDWANFPNAIPAIVARLQGVCIERRPALRLVTDHDSPTTLFYCDPPYVRSTREARQRKTYKHEFTDRQHRNLGNALRAVQGMVVISGYACSLYDRELFADWLRVEKQSNADGARSRTEVLWLNKKAEEGLSQFQLFRNSGGGKNLRLYSEISVLKSL